jgi:hypothetical protein
MKEAKARNPSIKLYGYAFSLALLFYLFEACTKHTHAHIGFPLPLLPIRIHSLALSLLLYAPKLRALDSLTSLLAVQPRLQPSVGVCGMA